MNREQRRAITRKPGVVICEVPRGSPLADGEEFTIPGMQYDRKAKRWIEGCAPGTETVLTAATCQTPGVLRIICK